MKEEICNFLSIITVSIIISLIFTLLFFNGVIETVFPLVILAFVLALVSLIILSILGSSDNGLTRKNLCKQSLFILISIIGSIFSNLITLLIPLSENNIISAFFVGLSLFFTILNLFSIAILLISISRFLNN